MHSMTGYGRAGWRGPRFSIEVEARSVNHRFLTVKASLPEGMERHESEVERIVRSRLARGSVSVVVTLASPDDEAAAWPDAAQVKRAYRWLDGIRRGLRIRREIAFEAVLSVPQLWQPQAEARRLARKGLPLIRKLVRQAVSDLALARRREGEGIRRDLIDRLRNVEAAVGRIRERAPEVLVAYQRRLRERIASLTTGQAVPLDPGDVTKEIAVYADRCDISEEVQRLGSHIASFRKILRQRGPVGRRLDFLTQEMVRETSTIAAKGNDGLIAEAALEIRAELEKIKEQAENVE